MFSFCICRSSSVKVTTITLTITTFHIVSYSIQLVPSVSGILVTYSQEKGESYQYNVVLVVSITELVKLVTCLIIYCSMYVATLTADRICVQFSLSPCFVSFFFFRNSWYIFFEQTFIHIKREFLIGICNEESIWDHTLIFALISVLWLYFIPAFLYCLYNNLSFVNLLNYDPATYFILLQLRVVITGVLFQVM